MKIILIGCILFTALSVLGQVTEKAKSFNWQTLEQAGQVTEGEPVGDSLKLVNASGQPKTFRILAISEPGITSPSYGITGRVKYEGVQGVGYLELLNHFSEGKVYFTRTMAPGGLLGSIQGSSGWRAFSLPFQVRNDAGWLSDRPERLEVNLVLQGNGTVYIDPIELVEYATGIGSQSTDNAWWSRSFGNKLGAYLGSLLGVLAGTIGWIGGRGKARGLVMPFFRSLLVLGACLLVAGIVALVLRQPYMVYYPLLLLGTIAVAISPSCLRRFRKQYEAAELRLMSAMDA